MTGDRTPRRHRWRSLRRVALGLIAAIGLYLAGRGGLRLWNASLPADAPRIAMTPDDGWLARLGFTTLTYDQIFSRAGGRLLKLEIPDHPQGLQPPAIGKLLEGMDALLLTGGGDVDPALYGGDPATAQLVNRRRDDFEIALIREARARNLPILGICRGCQILNVAFGGKLVDLDADEKLRATHFTLQGHPVDVQPKSLLATIVGAGEIANVQSYHRQAVGHRGSGVRVVARSPDRTVEAIEVNEFANEWTLAVQWHPEMTVNDALQLSLIRAFVDEARRRRPNRAARGSPR